jgi:hypothetical protein
MMLNNTDMIEINNGYIKLTKGNGRTPMLINLNKVIYIEPQFDEVGSKIHYDGGYLYASESFEQIEGAILETIDKPIDDIEMSFSECRNG